IVHVAVNFPDWARLASVERSKLPKSIFVAELNSHDSLIVNLTSKFCVGAVLACATEKPKTDEMNKETYAIFFMRLNPILKLIFALRIDELLIKVGEEIYAYVICKYIIYLEKIRYFTLNYSN